MAETPVPISTGSGAASIAADVVSNISYQQIKLVDGTLGNNTALIVNSDGTLNARISGSVLSAGSTFNGSVSGTVGASIIGIAPVFIVGGSIAGTFTTPNQSVSGTVGASVIGWVPVQTSNTSVITVSQSSSIIGVVTGSVVAIPTGNQSVSGALFVSGSVLLGSSNASVISYIQNSVATVIIGGSIAASFTPPANQSVSGTVTALQLAGSTLAVSGSFSPAGNQSVSGTVGASVIGWAPVQWSNSSVITVAQSSVAVAIVSGSIAATFTPPANQSVSGTVNIGTGGPVSVTGTMSVLGTVPVTQATASNPWIITGSVQGSFSPSGNQSVSGAITVSGSVLLGSSNASVISYIQGSVAAVIVGGSIATATTNSSVMLLNGANTIGSVTALQGTNPWAVVNIGSIISLNIGSVITTQIGSVITVWKDSSVLSVPVGSTIAVLQAASVVGTYAEDAASASGDKGIFALAVRNDTMASVTSADGDYSAQAVGPSGEVIVANSPLTKWIQGTADFRQGNAGASILVIANGTSSVFQYITGVQVANMGSASVLVTLAAGGSILGYTIAPAGGGSNFFTANGLKTPGSFGFAASLSGIASVLVSAQGFISKS